MNIVYEKIPFQFRRKTYEVVVFVLTSIGTHCRRTYFSFCSIVKYSKYPKERDYLGPSCERKFVYLEHASFEHSA